MFHRKGRTTRRASIVPAARRGGAWTYGYDEPRLRVVARPWFDERDAVGTGARPAPSRARLLVAAAAAAALAVVFVSDRRAVESHRRQGRPVVAAVQTLSGREAPSRHAPSAP
jgi:hypothetical protein